MITSNHFLMGSIHRTSESPSYTLCFRQKIYIVLSVAFPVTSLPLIVPSISCPFIFGGQNINIVYRIICHVQIMHKGHRLLDILPQVILAGIEDRVPSCEHAVVGVVHPGLGVVQV